MAFIYKSLNCTHSLQPSPVSPSDARYTDPVTPALKSEGWILWSTIQLLLAPDEHAEFLRQAVSKWDVRVPGSNDIFPKVLPRSCFPSGPDATMQSWYDGMTERLRKEMEEEEHKHVRNTDERPDSPMRKQYNLRDVRSHGYDDSDDDDSTTDSRDFALAYFRNPLFRTVDGRSGVVRRVSKRPPLSPRQSFVQKGKTAAATVTRVVQSVASPHLWDGHGTKQARDAADHRRRKSLPDKNRFADDGAEHVHSSPFQNSPAGLYPRYNHEKHSSHRRGSQQADSPPPDQIYWNTPNDADAPRRSHSQRSYVNPHPDVHHRRGHEVHVGSKEYFPPPAAPSVSSYDGEDALHGHSHGRPSSRNQSHHRRSSNANLDLGRAGGNGSPLPGAGFVPSASPLFATHVARGEVSGNPYRSGSRPPMPRRADYRSPERVSSASVSSRPNSGREEWNGSDNGAGGSSGVGRTGSLRLDRQKGGNRYSTPLGLGLDGRRYPPPGELPYRGR